MGIILRQNKGSELTFGEVDGNFQSLYYSSSLEGSNLDFYFASSSISHSINLNTIPGFSGITIESGSTQIETGVNVLNFLGSGIASITSAGGNQVDINIQGGGGSGSGSGDGVFQLLAGTDIYFTTSSLQITGSTIQQSPSTTTGANITASNSGTGGGVDKYDLTISKSIWHYTDNIGVPTSKAWKTDLEGSYFNRYDHNTDTAEIVRFMAGLLSSSAPDTSPNTLYYANTSEVKTNTTTTSAPVGYIPQSSTNSTITYLNGKGFATPGQTIFSGISSIYSNPNYKIRYTSLSGGSTSVSSSADPQLFGLGDIGIAFNVSGVLDRTFANNSAKTPSSNNQTQYFLTKTGSGTVGGLTIGNIVSSSPLIPDAYQDGKFITIFDNNLYNNSIPFSTIESTGYYQLSSSIGVQSGSSNYSTYFPQSTEIFYTPINDSNFTQGTSFQNLTSSSISATSRSLSGAPLLSTSNFTSGVTFTGYFAPLFAANSTFARVIKSNSLVTLTNGGTGVYQGSTSGGSVQTTNFIYDDSSKTTLRAIGVVPHESDVAIVTASIAFNAGVGGSENINQIGFGTTTFTTQNQALNRNSTYNTVNTQTYEYFKSGTYGQNVASGSMGYYGRAQGYDGGLLTTFSEAFTGENYRIKITDNLLSGSYAQGDKFTVNSYQEYVQDPLELQVKPGYLVTPGGTYGYWTPSNPSANTYQYYARAFQRNSSTGASSMTLNLGVSLNSWQSTSNGISTTIVFQSSNIDNFTPPRIYDPTQTTSNVIDSNIATNNSTNPFSDNIALYGNSGGSIGGTTYTIPLRDIDGMVLDGTNQNFIVIVRYKGDPTPITGINITIT